MQALRASILSVAALAACNDPAGSSASSIGDSAATQSTGAGTGDSSPTSTDPTTASTTASPTATGEPTTDATTTSSSDTISDTSSDTSATGGSTGPTCPEGQQGCPCGQGDTCDGDLECEQGLCQPPPSPTCGDGVLDPGEQCDQGPANSDTGACKTDCTPATCGDGLLGPGELCDDGNQVDADACGNDCAPASCGDGKPGPGEQCDDGNQVDTDACTNACAAASCGDGIVHAGVEQCDDGNQVNTDACTSACQPAKCGDGYVQPGEQCDDGNQTDGDGCEKTCKPTPQNLTDACGFPADDGVWLEIDYSNAFSVTNPTWTYSPTPGWGEAQWAPQGKNWPEVWNVFNNATIITDQIGKVALLDGGNKAVQIMFGIAGLTYDYATVCVQGRSYSVGSSVIFTAQNQLNKCGGTGTLSNSWEVHKAGVDIGGCIVQNNDFQGLRVFPSGGSSALSLKRLRLTLHGAVY